MKTWSLIIVSLLLLSLVPLVAQAADKQTLNISRRTEMLTTVAIRSGLNPVTASLIGETLPITETYSYTFNTIPIRPYEAASVPYGTIIKEISLVFSDASHIWDLIVQERNSTADPWMTKILITNIAGSRTVTLNHEVHSFYTRIIATTASASWDGTATVKVEHRSLTFRWPDGTYYVVVPPKIVGGNTGAEPTYSSVGRGVKVTAETSIGFGRRVTASTGGVPAGWPSVDELDYTGIATTYVRNGCGPGTGVRYFLISGSSTVYDCLSAAEPEKEIAAGTYRLRSEFIVKSDEAEPGRGDVAPVTAFAWLRERNPASYSVEVDFDVPFTAKYSASFTTPITAPSVGIVSTKIYIPAIDTPMWGTVTVFGARSISTGLNVLTVEFQPSAGINANIGAEFTLALSGSVRYTSIFLEDAADRLAASLGVPYWGYGTTTLISGDTLRFYVEVGSDLYNAVIWARLDNTQLASFTNLTLPTGDRTGVGRTVIIPIDYVDAYAHKIEELNIAKYRIGRIDIAIMDLAAGTTEVQNITATFVSGSIRRTFTSGQPINPPIEVDAGPWSVEVSSTVIRRDVVAEDGSTSPIVLTISYHQRKITLGTREYTVSLDERISPPGFTLAADSSIPKKGMEVTLTGLSRSKQWYEPDIPMIVGVSAAQPFSRPYVDLYSGSTRVSSVTPSAFGVAGWIAYIPGNLIDGSAFNKIKILIPNKVVLVVKDASGDRLPGAKITLETTVGTQVFKYTGTTNSTGGIVFENIRPVSGTYTIIVEYNGYTWTDAIPGDDDYYNPDLRTGFDVTVTTTTTAPPGGPEGGMPSWIWIVLAAVLILAVALLISRRGGRHRADVDGDTVLRL
jgi:hypothetical protein